MSRQRVIVASLSLSAAALVGIAVHEGYRGDAYTPVKGDVPTIGFGTTGGVRMGDKTDPVRALIRLNQDADAYQRRLRQCIRVPLHQHEWDAYVSWAYNVGTGAACGSTLMRKLNAGDYEGACNELLRWTYASGRQLPGLVKRRQQERALCLGETP